MNTNSTKPQKIGFCAFYANNTISKVAYISIIVISKSFQSKGFGRRFIVEISQVAKEKGMHTIQLEVDKSNHQAINFYYSLNFSPISESKKSYKLEKKLS